MGLPSSADPFSSLGLPAQADLTDDDVRSAWRRIAAATHPDRADGGDPGRFALAGAAYTMLRTRSGRGEALADLASRSPRAGWARPAWAPSGRLRPTQDRHGRPPARAAVPAEPGADPVTGIRRLRLVSRIRRGRPARLALRVLIAAAVSVIAVAVAGSQPATPALITGALTWLLLTAPHDLAPPPDSPAHPPP
jgi:curved DNA-binding protein CbpA